jgi:hypothetical protein
MLVTSSGDTKGISFAGWTVPAVSGGKGHFVGIEGGSDTAAYEQAWFSIQLAVYRANRLKFGLEGIRAEVGC